MTKNLFVLGCLVLISACSGSSSETPSGQAPTGSTQGPPASPTPSPSPSPEPDPSTVAPQIASSWSEVKYAFCSAQGRYGVLVDFRGSDLTTNPGGTAQLGWRSCSASTPFRWSDPQDFSVSMNHKVLTFNFGSGDTIRVSMKKPSGGSGVFSGNSGPCAFLKNEGTQDIFASEPFFRCE